MPDVLKSFDFLLLPCRDNAGPDHWQSHWQAALPNMTRVEQDDWVSPKLGPWAARLDEYISRARRPVVLIAHSLGTSLIMHWAQTADTSRIAGAFMVAPSDRGPADIWPEAATKPLPFPAMVLASRDDSYVAFDRAEVFASAWRAALVDMGQAGHMGNAADLGLWPAGLIHLGAFLGTLTRPS